MIRRTPFHERTGVLNETGLWSHWSGYLAAEKYSLSEKFEYFAVRNSAGILDTTPLFKYRFTGSDAATFLAGVIARDPRTLAPGRAQYTIWCDDRGFIVEDGVLLRHGPEDFAAGSPRVPNRGDRRHVDRRAFHLAIGASGWAAGRPKWRGSPPFGTLTVPRLVSGARTYRSRAARRSARVDK
jgi:glycine cleavage system aminomethyltransferase T